MNQLDQWNVVLVGCGRMGSALATGACDSGALEPTSLYCVDIAANLAQTLADRLGAKAELPDGDKPRLWVIAVKPGDLAAALEPYSFASHDIVLSVAAGKRLATVREIVGNGPRLARAMPNTPALVGAGITGIYAEDADALDLTHQLFGGVGEVVSLAKESQFDAVTAVSGSGPAYVFVAIEALADGGVLMGLDRLTATRLAIHTVLGGASLAADADAPHVAELKDRVASPGGTTIAGLEALEARGFRGALIEAVRAAAERSRELGE